MHKGCPDMWFGHAPPKLKLDTDRSGPSNERMSRLAQVRILRLCFRKAFYSAQEKAIAMLTKHFDVLYNDGCPAGGTTFITVLGG